MFMVSPEGIVQSWNHGAQRLKRYRAHEVVGGPIHRFFPPETQDSAARLIEDAIVKGTATYEGWLVRKGGERFWALCTLSAVEDESGHLRGLSNVARDLTERKRTEDALRDSEERLRLLVNSVQDYAVFMVSASGEVISWNAGAERLHGFTAPEAVGTFVARLLGVSEADAGMAERLLQRAREVGRAEFEGWLMRKGGATFWASVIFSAVRDSAGNLHGYSVVAREPDRADARGPGAGVPVRGRNPARGLSRLPDDAGPRRPPRDPVHGAVVRRRDSRRGHASSGGARACELRRGAGASTGAARHSGDTADDPGRRPCRAERAAGAASRTSSASTRSRRRWGWRRATASAPS